MYICSFIYLFRFSLAELNHDLCVPLTDAEARFNTKASPDLSKLKRYKFEFTPDVVGSPLQTYYLQICNSGFLTTSFHFHLSNEKELELEPWCSADEPTEEVLTQICIIEEMKCFTLEPRMGVLNPGEKCLLKLSYSHNFLKYGGIHHLPVHLKIDQGKQMYLDILGRTIMPAPAVSRGVSQPTHASVLKDKEKDKELENIPDMLVISGAAPDGSFLLQPVPIGLNAVDAPRQQIEIFNLSQNNAVYEVSLTSLDKFADKYFGLELFKITNPKGELAARSSTHIDVYFYPTEVRLYQLPLIIKYMTIPKPSTAPLTGSIRAGQGGAMDGMVKTRDIKIKGSQAKSLQMLLKVPAYDPRLPKPLPPESSYLAGLPPSAPLLILPGQFACLSEDLVDFGLVPQYCRCSRLVLLRNLSHTSVVDFTVDDSSCSLMGPRTAFNQGTEARHGGLLNVSPLYGRIDPGSHVVLEFNFDATCLPIIVLSRLKIHVREVIKIGSRKHGSKHGTRVNGTRGDGSSTPAGVSVAGGSTQNGQIVGAAAVTGLDFGSTAGNNEGADTGAQDPMVAVGAEKESVVTRVTANRLVALEARGTFKNGRVPSLPSTVNMLGDVVIKRLSSSTSLLPFQVPQDYDFIDEGLFAPGSMPIMSDTGRERLVGVSEQIGSPIGSRAKSATFQNVARHPTGSPVSSVYGGPGDLSGGSDILSASQSRAGNTTATPGNSRSRALNSSNSRMTSMSRMGSSHSEAAGKEPLLGPPSVLLVRITGEVFAMETCRKVFGRGPLRSVLDTFVEARVKPFIPMLIPVASESQSVHTELPQVGSGSGTNTPSSSSGLVSRRGSNAAVSGAAVGLTSAARAELRMRRQPEVRHMSELVAFSLLKDVVSSAELCECITSVTTQPAGGLSVPQNSAQANFTLINHLGPPRPLKRGTREHYINNVIFSKEVGAEAQGNNYGKYLDPIGGASYGLYFQELLEPRSLCARFVYECLLLGYDSAGSPDVPLLIAAAAAKVPPQLEMSQCTLNLLLREASQRLSPATAEMLSGLFSMRKADFYTMLITIGVTPKGNVYKSIDSIIMSSKFNQNLLPVKDVFALLSEDVSVVLSRKLVGYAAKKKTVEVEKSKVLVTAIDENRNIEDKNIEIERESFCASEAEDYFDANASTLKINTAEVDAKDAAIMRIQNLTRGSIARTHTLQQKSESFHKEVKGLIVKPDGVFLDILQDILRNTMFNLIQEASFGEFVIDSEPLHFMSPKGEVGNTGE